MDLPNLQNILRISLAATIAAAVVSTLAVYLAFKVHRVDVGLARMVKPGTVENLYRRNPKMRSLLLDIAVRISGWSKILSVLVAVVFVVLRSLGR